MRGCLDGSPLASPKDRRKLLLLRGPSSGPWPSLLPFTPLTGCPIRTGLLSEAVGALVGQRIARRRGHVVKALTRWAIGKD